MFSLNNKGQSLVMFILLIPIFLMILALVVDIGNIVIEKQELNNINSLAIDYALDHLNDNDLKNKMTEIISINSSDINYIDININEGIVKVNTKKEVSSLMSHVFGISIFKVSSTFQGKKENNKKIIERIKG